MSGNGIDIYVIGIVMPLLLGVMITLIMLAARDPRSGHPQPDSRDEDQAARAGRPAGQRQRESAGPVISRTRR